MRNVRVTGVLSMIGVYPSTRKQKDFTEHVVAVSFELPMADALKLRDDLTNEIIAVQAKERADGATDPELLDER